MIEWIWCFRVGGTISGRGKALLDFEKENLWLKKIKGESAVKRFRHDLALRIVKILDAVMITIPFAICWYWYYSERTASPYHAKGDLLIIFIYFALYIIIGRVYDGFLMSMQRISEIIYSQSLAFAVCDGILYIIIWLLSKHLPNILPGLMAFCGQILLAAVWAYLANHWYFRTFPPCTTAVIYGRHSQMTKLIDEYGMNKKYDVKKTVSAAECIVHIEMLADMETVFLSGVHSHERNVILKYCIARGITVYVVPCIGDVIMSGANPMHMFHLPLLQVKRYMAQPEYLFLTRAMDIFFSLAALVIASPVMIVTAIAIKAEDGGPVLYKQVRLTKNARPFEIVKFRSMQPDAEKDGVARLSTGEKDDRITFVGRVIRKYRIDELPQLFNILEGSLSIVGPRPERPEIAAQYCEHLPEFELRLQAKAGLTGYAQVYGKYNTTPYDKLQMDLMYIAHPSLIEDMKIVLATVKILFKPESTEGVAEGQATAARLEMAAATDSENTVQGKRCIKGIS